MYRNLKIKNNGFFYETSKTPKDGFEKIETKTGVIVYHKYYPNVSGRLRGIYLDKKDWGEIITISLDDVQDPTLRISIDLPVFSYGERIDDYAKSLIQSLENLKVGEFYSFGLNRTKTDNKGYLYKTIYIRDSANELVKWAFELKDVPKAVSNTSKVTGKTTWDFSDQDAFYYHELKRVIGSKNSLAAATPEVESTPEAPSIDSSKSHVIELDNNIIEEFKDLPF